MNIAVDVREWQPGSHTGIGRFLTEFLTAASGPGSPHRFLLLGNRRSENRLPDRTIPFVRIPGSSTLWWDQVALPRRAARWPADLLYSPYIKIPLVSPIPTVCTVHDLTFMRCPPPSAQVRLRAKNLLFQFFCRLVFRRASALIADSRTTARDIGEIFAVEPARIHVVALATSPLFHPMEDPTPDLTVLGRYGLAPGYVLYVGGFAAHKNVHRLVESHAALPKNVRANHPLVLVGRAIPPALRACLEASGSTAGSRWIGPIPDAELPALYRRAALLAFPSCYEGFGLPVLEAMACGTPVLCSTAPALVELAGDAAMHAPPEDTSAWRASLGRLLADEIVRADLTVRGLARASTFTPSRMSEGILRVFESAVERGRRGRCRG